jgi:SAM-dependent methyltransferase
MVLGTDKQRGVEVPVVAGLNPPTSGDPSAWISYFEEVYRDAAGDATRVPWAHERPSPALVTWLNREAPGLMRPGARVAVVGCGLGDDVRELADRGYDPVGFDVSPTAVEWARQRFPALRDRYVVADAMSPPPSLQRRADLVVEINTLQAVHPTLREHVARGVVSLARPKGLVLAVCRGREPGEPAATAPPFALTVDELTGLFGACGWAPMREVDDFLDDESPARRRLRAAFRKRES